MPNAGELHGKGNPALLCLTREVGESILVGESVEIILVERREKVARVLILDHAFRSFQSRELGLHEHITTFGVTVSPTAFAGSRLATLGITAPRDVRVLRSELKSREQPEQPEQSEKREPVAA